MVTLLVRETILVSDGSYMGLYGGYTDVTTEPKGSEMVPFLRQAVLEEVTVVGRKCRDQTVVTRVT